MLGAGGKDDGSLVSLCKQGRGRISARAAYHLLFAIGVDAHDGVIVACDDRAVVAEKAIGDVSECIECLAVGGDDGLAATIAARHHEGRAELVQEQMLQGRRRKHEPDFGQVAGDVRGDGGACRALEQHDGTCRVFEQCGFPLAHLRVRAGHVKIAHHDGKRLGGTTFAGAQAADGIFVACVAC